MDKKELFNKIVKQLEPKETKGISGLLKDMTNTGFQGRKLGEAYEIWKSMLEEKEITIFLGISGAIVPAGQRKLLIELIKRRYIDAIVSTGAQLFHDADEALGSKHYQGSPNLDDNELWEKHKTYRIYDVLSKMSGCESTAIFFRDKLAPRLENRPYSDREVLELIGKILYEEVGNNTILSSAYEQKIPIFCPSIADSYLGWSILIGKIKYNKNNFDIGIANSLKEAILVAAESKATGAIYLGGGVPKNYIQQTAEMCNDLKNEEYMISTNPILDETKGHKYTIQITTATPTDGSLSGATLSEGISWGKAKSDSKLVTCYCDITIALPFLVHALNEDSKDIAEKRKKPYFEWLNNLALSNLKIIYK